MAAHQAVLPDKRFTGTEIRYCTDGEAFYVTIGQGAIADTAHISADVIVDTEADGTVHGIELLCRLGPTARADSEVRRRWHGVRRQPIREGCQPRAEPARR